MLSFLELNGDKMITDEYIVNFLSNYDLDVRKAQTARWLDQKCTPDVVNVVADCILQYLKENGDDTTFTRLDIQFSDYSEKIVLMYYNKPRPSDKKAKSEYDKFFGMPLKLFSYAHILNENNEKRPYKYTVINKELLEYISINEKHSTNFLYHYMLRILEDSGILDDFNRFFEIQSRDEYYRIKDKFFDFTITNTKINGQDETYRIFTKLINTLAFIKHKKGTKKGRLSKDVIIYNDLVYNQKNFRDIYSNKPKGITRKEWAKQQDVQMNIKCVDLHKSDRETKFLKKFNDDYRNGCTEVLKGKHVAGEATNMHHIFLKSDFPEISFLRENIVALSPNQHFLCAHPKNHTNKINKSYQKLILEEKLERINENITNSNIETIYSYDSYVEVLNEGFNKDFETRYNNYSNTKSILRECYEDIELDESIC